MARGRAAGLPIAELEPLAENMRRARETADEPVPPAAETEAWAGQYAATAPASEHTLLQRSPVVYDQAEEPGEPASLPHDAVP